MTNRTMPVMIAGALGLTGAIAAAAEPTAQELLEQIKQLQTKVEQIEASEAQAKSTATVESVLQNAEQRSQLLADQPFYYGHDGTRFGMSNEDGTFTLNPGVQVQFRNTTNWGEDADGDDELENGFEIRRLKLELTGTAFTKNLHYAFVGAADREGGEFRLEDAWIMYMCNDDWGFRLGQFKDPLGHEELTSSKRQLAADRSLMNEVLLGGLTDRVQGISAIYGNYDADNPIAAEVSFHDGFNSDNTDFQDGMFDYGFAGRIEYKASGNWRDYADFTSKNTQDNLLVFGAGADWSAGGDQKVLTLTGDVQYEMGQLGLFGAVSFNDAEEVPAGTDGTNLGLVLQAGYMMNANWEPFARYSGVFLDDDFEVGDEDTLHELTAGFNYYLGEDGRWGHRAKITVDVGLYPNGAPAGHTGIGVVGSDEDQIVVRGQLQLLL